MTLLLTFLIATFVISLLFLGGALLLQSWLYNQPADRLPLRALVSGSVVAAFLTFWCWVDSKNPGKYSSLLDFAGYETLELQSLEAVRKVGEQEQFVPYTKRGGGKASSEFIDPRGTPFRRSDTDGMVVALRFKEKDKEEYTRFNANLTKDGKFPDELKFTEENSRRYIAAENIGLVIRPRSGLVIWNLLLNGLHFVVWLLAIWLGLRFTFGPAFGIAFSFWLFVMLIVLPVMFQQVRSALPPPAVAIEAK